MEIRTLTAADIDVAADLTARVFGTPAQYDEYYGLSRAANLYCPYTPPELCYGLFDGGRLVAKSQLVDLQVRVLGVPIRTAGPMAVAAEPGFRDVDAIARLAEAAHAEVIRRGFDLVLGVAQRGAAYQRLGAAPICAETSWECDALYVPEPRSALFRAASESDVGQIVELYNAGNAARSGSLVRSPELYAFLPRRASDVRVATDGYVALRDHADAIEVREVAGRTDGFFDAALREVARLARARGVRRVFGGLPGDHALVAASVPYGSTVNFQFARAAGCMAAVVAPQRLLQQLAPVLTERVRASRFADARVTLSLRVDAVECELVLNEAGTRSVALVSLEPITMGALAQLVFGYRAARWLLPAMASTNDATALLDVLWSQPAPFMWFTDRF